MHTPASAATDILSQIAALPSQDVQLPDALDRVLAADVVSPVNLPHWDNSAMDGYAVRSTDIAGKSTTRTRDNRGDSCRDVPQQRRGSRTMRENFHGGRRLPGGSTP